MWVRVAAGCLFTAICFSAGNANAKCTMASPGAGWKKAGPAYKAIYDCRDATCGKGSRIEMAWAKKKGPFGGLAGTDSALRNSGTKIRSPIPGRQAYRKIGSKGGKIEVLETHHVGGDAIADVVLISSISNDRVVAVRNAGIAASAVSCR